MIYRFNVTPEIRELAEKHTFIEYKIDPIRHMGGVAGNLAEIATAAYFKVEWNPKRERDTGIDVYLPETKQTIQVKSVLDSPEKRKIFLEKRKNVRFDIYSLCIVSQDLSYVDIYVIGDKHFIEMNSQKDFEYGSYILYR